MIAAAVFRASALVLLGAPAIPAAAVPGGRAVIVVCAPGFPGNTEQAGPTMDRFAAAVEAAAGRPAGSVGAVYHESEAGGVGAIKRGEVALALVPLPFFLKHAGDLRLDPILTVVQESGPLETWSLAAKRGRVKEAAALAGWEILGSPGYAPAFVRGPAFGSWGALPADARIVFTASALSGLRRAAAGEKVAVMLDASQAAALPSLPFAADLEIVARSRPLPGTLLCGIGGRSPAKATAAILGALPHLHETPPGREALQAMRMVRFEAADRSAIDAVLRAYAAAGISPAAPAGATAAGAPTPGSPR